MIAMIQILTADMKALHIEISTSLKLPFVFLRGSETYRPPPPENPPPPARELEGEVQMRRSWLLKNRH